MKNSYWFVFLLSLMFRQMVEKLRILFGSYCNISTCMLVSLISYWRPTPLIPVTVATRNARFAIFEFQNFTDTYLGKVTKFQFNCFSPIRVKSFKTQNVSLLFSNFSILYNMMLQTSQLTQAR